MADDKEETISRLEQLPISALPEEWPLPVKLAWLDNTVTTNVTIDESEIIKGIARNAQGTASAANVTANDAQTTAIDAKTTATDAATKANSVLGVATDAKNAADSAETTATDAKNAADSAETTAADAKTAADDAKTAVSGLDTRVTANETQISQNIKDIAENKKKIAEGGGGSGGGGPASYASDYLVEEGTGTNGWYRLYASGWCEQGGVVIGQNMPNQYQWGGEYDFPKPFATTDGLVVLGENENASGTYPARVGKSASSDQQTKRFRIYIRDLSGTVINNRQEPVSWYAVGQCEKPTLPPVPVTPHPQAVDYIVEQKREADGRWYRKYASGYIEQGGKALTQVGVQYLTVDYLTPFTDLSSLLFVGHYGGARNTAYVTAGPAPGKELTAVELVLRNPDNSIYTKTAEAIRYKIEGY